MRSRRAVEYKSQIYTQQLTVLGLVRVVNVDEAYVEVKWVRHDGIHTINIPTQIYITNINTADNNSQCLASSSS